MNSKQANIRQRGKFLLSAILVLVFFGFVTVILSGFAGRETVADRVYMGDFTEEQIEQRWANLEEVKKEQAEVYSESAVSEAMTVLASAKTPTPETSEFVAPGTPTALGVKPEVVRAPTDPVPESEPTEEGSKEEGTADPEEGGSAEDSSSSGPAPAAPEEGTEKTEDPSSAESPSLTDTVTDTPAPAADQAEAPEVSPGKGGQPKGAPAPKAKSGKKAAPKGKAGSNPGARSNPQPESAGN
ncbi:MAG: hypothetical protein AAF357_00795 [Verrucomicrobiota bacterium]